MSEDQHYDDYENEIGPDCPSGSNHNVTRGRKSSIWDYDKRVYWYCLHCRGVIKPAAEDRDAELATVLHELAEELKYGETTITHQEIHPDKTAKITHHTYVVGAGLDRVEVKFRRPDEG
jgi:hypothetical protein